MPHLVLAYIDPGSGSLIIQAIIAGVIALPVIFRHRVAQVVRVLRRRTGEEGHADDGPRPG